MNRFDDVVLARVNGQAIALGSVLRSPALQDEVRRVLQQAADRLLVREACRQAGLSASTAELQAAFNDFRKGNGLRSADRTRQWLDERGLTLDDVEDEVRYRVLERKWLARLESGTEQYFHEHKAQYQQVSLARVLVADGDLAAELLAELEEGEVGFDEMVVRSSIDDRSRHRGGFWGDFHRHELPAELAGAAFGARPGDVLGPFQGSEGWSLVRIISVREAKLDEATRAAVTQSLYRTWLEGERRQSRLEILAAGNREASSATGGT